MLPRIDLTGGNFADRNMTNPKLNGSTLINASFNIANLSNTNITGANFNFFFQAEYGIRDFHVTGVQTCALPISYGSLVTVSSYHVLDETGRIVNKGPI